MPVAHGVGVFQPSAQPTRRRRGGAGVEEAGHAVRQIGNQGAEIPHLHPPTLIAGILEMAVHFSGWSPALRSRLCPIGPSASLRADQQPSLPSGHPAKGVGGKMKPGAPYEIFRRYL